MVNTDLQCCNNGSMCNDYLVMKLPTQHSPPEDDTPYFAGRCHLLQGTCFFLNTNLKVDFDLRSLLAFARKFHVCLL